MTADEFDPRFSPDGQLIAFRSGDRLNEGSLYIMEATGEGRRRLDVNGHSPDWSPDGTQIAFAGNRSGNWDIYTMGLDGNSVRQLSNHEKNDIEPVWSPDGTLLAFASARTTTAVGWEIFFVDVESGEVSGSGKAGYPTDWFSEIEDSG